MSKEPLRSGQLSLLALAAFSMAAACGGGGASGSGGGSSRMQISLVSNGFGTILPHRTKELGPDGQPTVREIELTTIDKIIRNVSAANPILPPTSWSEEAELPDGTPGNHFIMARFSRALDVDSVLDGSVGAVGGLRNSIQVLVFDPDTKTTVQVPGRAFVGGATYGLVDNRPPPEGDPSRRRLEQWIVIENGVPVLNRDLEGYDFMEGGVFIPERHPGFGFPGAQIDSSTPSFAGAVDLISSRSFVFVPDSTPGLDSLETFPVGKQIRMRMTREVRAFAGQALLEEGLASATVGDDGIRPEVAVSGQSNKPLILPEDGEIDVDPTTSITVEFTEPVQPFTVGEIDPAVTPQPSAGIQVQFGPPTKLVTVPYLVRLFSPFDLSRVELVPAFNFPSNTESVSGVSCGVFGEVTIQVNADQLADFNGLTNEETPSSRFKTGDGPALVNVPVAPDVIYIGRSGSRPGLSVIDLNGFGQGTGNPDYNGIQDPIVEGNSNFPNNPNLQLGPTIFPPIQQGTCTVDGGSEGVFTLSKDSALNDLVVRAPVMESIGEMAIGHGLDTSFNNGTPFGCQAGGGNLCAFSGLKVIQITAQGNGTIGPTPSNFIFESQLIGVENLISWSPHPNPPALVFPPLCLSPLIGGDEPTSIDVFLGPMGLGGVQNLLTPGPTWQGDPDINRPPTDLLANQQNQFFLGPSGPPQPGQGFSGCTPYMMRQQIGHFLYVIDQVAGELVVLNSNRMTVIERIRLPDPTGLSLSPNLDLLAVSNRRAGVVSFIDTNPGSSRFHEVVKTVRVGRGPTGVTWESGNEDVFVCNEDDNSVSVISAFNLEVRKTLRSQLTGPFEISTWPRQMNFGLNRNVYFAYILNKNGRISIFESGPDGTNGWGFDAIVAQLAFQFDNPKTMQVDLSFANGAVWILHENPLDEVTGLKTGETGGAVSQLALLSGRAGVIALNMGQLGNPSARDLTFGIRISIGPDTLTGPPTDIAFDYQVNVFGTENFFTPYSAGTPARLNGRAPLRGSPFTSSSSRACSPRFMFLAVPTPRHFDPGDAEAGGVVDVIDMASGFRRIDTNPFREGVQSLPAPGAIRLADYVRQ